MLKDPVMVLIGTAFYAVDIFYFFGGFFSGYVLSAKLKKVKYFRFPLFYILGVILRILRIVPAYAACIFFYWKI